MGINPKSAAGYKPQPAVPAQPSPPGSRNKQGKSWSRANKGSFLPWAAGNRGKVQGWRTGNSWGWRIGNVQGCSEEDTCPQGGHLSSGKHTWFQPSQGMCHSGVVVSPHTILRRMTSHRRLSPVVTAGQTNEAQHLKNTSLLKI